MENVFILKESDLEKVMEKTFAKFLAKKEPEKQMISMDEAPGYLEKQGLKISKSGLYKLTANNEIPFKRFGKRRIVFDREALDNWADEQIGRA